MDESSFLFLQPDCAAQIRKLVRRLALIYTTPSLVEIIDALGRNPCRTENHIEPEDITVLVNLIRLRGELVIRFFKGEPGDVQLILRLDPLSHNRRLAKSGQSGDQRQRLALAAFK